MFFLSCQVLQATQRQVKKLPGSEISNWDDRVLNSRINNKANRPILERNETVQEVLAQIKMTQDADFNKPRVVALWSPRGTGKTSLLRHLAQREEYAESRKCGRLLVLDAQVVRDYVDQDPERLVRAIIIWHLLQIFHEHTVNDVTFQATSFADVMELVKGKANDDRFNTNLRSWFYQSGRTVGQVLEQWRSLTGTALGASDTCPLLIFMDQAELLAKEQQAIRSSKGGIKSAFTNLCSHLPQRMGVFCAGTLNLMEGVPHTEYTQLMVHRMPALAPLSGEAAATMMVQRSGKQYGNDVLKQVHLFSGGVPRLLEFAFQAPGELSTEVVAMNAMTMCFSDSYASAAPFFDNSGVALSLVLCSAVRWKVCERAKVPGTDIPWSEIFHAGAAFPSGDTVLVPRLWWCRDVAVSETLQQNLEDVNISLEDLLPDAMKLLQKSGGPTARGVPWEKCVANALAARFRLHCMERKSNANDTWVPFLELYPTQDEHLRRVLQPFEVCWCDGVDLPTKEATVLDKVGRAIKCNSACASAHHDLLIPVRRRDTGTEYMAAQCRYGSIKGANELDKTSQAKARKPQRGETVEDMPNVLLQICSEAKAGYQEFQSRPWKDRQDQHRYSLMNCSEIIAQLECFRLLR
ncbi:unnamed protein product [Symbiodinium sp. CCMP2592]|nr:unnamed protein product [Symbiodinium sp. CCMP2592]